MPTLTHAAAPQSDPRIIRSKAAIQQALLNQIAIGRDFESLTVSEIAERAGLTRKTFYARFGSLGQVVESVIIELFSDIASRIDDTMLRIPMTNNSGSMLVFRAYEAQREILAPLVRHCPTALFIKPVGFVVSNLLQRTIAINDLQPMNEADEAYLVAVIASTIHGVLSVWVERGFSESPEQVAVFLDNLLVDGLQKLLTSHSESSLRN
ncbi:TetR/AcrR family transcriptional regulator [Pseudomonadales bacterium]|nr:TetR/AcrR family transcriptional regulator [Pseudomonadales bacterium]MDG1002989.1 TetR/AcrR family transcriptional regulator [Pseudomonadales bacterium]|tara:strand:- start:7417 stop:8043 length:627 start_codon:yes stop_codon:yes gene_type:complete